MANEKKHINKVLKTLNIKLMGNLDKKKIADSFFSVALKNTNFSNASFYMQDATNQSRFNLIASTHENNENQYIYNIDDTFFIQNKIILLDSDSQEAHKIYKKLKIDKTSSIFLFSTKKQVNGFCVFTGDPAQKKDLILLENLIFEILPSLKNALIFEKILREKFTFTILNTQLENTLTKVKQEKNKLSSYKEIILNSQDAVAAISPKLLLTPINKAAEKLFSKKMDSSFSITEIFSSETLTTTDIQKNIQKAFQGTKSSTTMWLSFENNQETKRYYEVSVYPFSQDQAFEQNESEVILILKDISHIKDLEMRLIQSQKLEAIGTLASGIAHDFNNILSGIIGYAELTALKAQDNQQIRNYVNKILDASQRAGELINQLLSFSRKKITDTDIIPMPVQPILKEVLKVIQKSAPSSIKIQSNFNHQDILVNSSPTYLHQILINLCRAS